MGIVHNAWVAFRKDAQCVITSTSFIRNLNTIKKDNYNVLIQINKVKINDEYLIVVTYIIKNFLERCSNN